MSCQQQFVVFAGDGKAMDFHTNIVHEFVGPEVLRWSSYSQFSTQQVICFRPDTRGNTTMPCMSSAEPQIIHPCMLHFPDCPYKNQNTHSSYTFGVCVHSLPPHPPLSVYRLQAQILLIFEYKNTRKSSGHLGQHQRFSTASKYRSCFSGFLFSDFSELRHLLVPIPK